MEARSLSAIPVIQAQILLCSNKLLQFKPQHPPWFGDLSVYLVYGLEPRQPEAKFLDGLRGGESIPGIEKEPSMEYRQIFTRAH